MSKLGLDPTQLPTQHDRQVAGRCWHGIFAGRSLPPARATNGSEYSPAAMPVLRRCFRWPRSNTTPTTRRVVPSSAVMACCSRPPRRGSAAAKPKWALPPRPLGADTDAALGDWGFSAHEIGELRRAGIVGAQAEEHDADGPDSGAAGNSRLYFEDLRQVRRRLLAGERPRRRFPARLPPRPRRCRLARYCHSRSLRRIGTRHYRGRR